MNEFDNTEGQLEQQRQQMEDLGVTITKSSRGTIQTITIIGQIEGHQVLPPQSKTTKYEHILPMLADVEQNEEIDGVLIMLNTVGGDIEAGLAISELISGMKKPTVSLVLGGGHSIGVPLAVSAKVSMIVPSAAMTIHPVRTTGMVIAAPQTYNYFNKLQERIVDFVCRNSQLSKDRFMELMLAKSDMANDLGSVIYGEEAVSIGLIKKLGSLSDAMECLYGMIGKK
ncbi:MAG: peptidase S14 [Ruminococcaceae bacterium]|nr:peptidase S14 [Oscillospiraceae bacterium]